MKGGIIFGLSAACIGLSLYLAMTKNEKPVPVTAPEVVARVTTPAKPPAPIVLANVVEVTDLDPLLDPPEKPIAGVPFDADPMTFPVSVPAAAPIPHAADELEIAPMPRETTHQSIHWLLLESMFGSY